MTDRMLGKTGLRLSPVSFGAITVSSLSCDETRDLVERAIGAGINYFDTAHSYADTSSKLGKLLPEIRDSAYLGAKVLDRTCGEAYQRLISSLEDLSVDSTDIMWLHAVDKEETLDQVLGEGGAIEALIRCREEARTRFLGITGHRPDLIARAVLRFPFDVVMTPVNYHYRYSFGAEMGLIPLCKSKEVGIVAIKPRAYQTLPDMRTSYRYVLGLGVTTVIPHGSPSEMDAAISVIGDLDEMGKEEEARLLSGSPELEGVCRQCGYCLPCPRGVNIPYILKLGDIWHGPHRVKERNPGYAIQTWAREAYAKLGIGGDSCDSCGECEKRCPFGVKIVEQLEIAHGKLENK
jgi:predicted aldo/keto reductase-like oxidoreductase